VQNHRSAPLLESRAILHLHPPMTTHPPLRGFTAVNVTYNDYLTPPGGYALWGSRAMTRETHRTGAPNHNRRYRFEEQPLVKSMDCHPRTRSIHAKAPAGDARGRSLSPKITRKFATRRVRPDPACWMLHIVDYRLAELRALEQLRSGHQALEIVSHGLIGERLLQSANNPVGRLLPSHVLEHHHARQDD
jgi:hypothetical protein